MRNLLMRTLNLCFAEQINASEAYIRDFAESINAK